MMMWIYCTTLLMTLSNCESIVLVLTLDFWVWQKKTRNIDDIWTHNIKLFIMCNSFLMSLFLFTYTRNFDVDEEKNIHIESIISEKKKNLEESVQKKSFMLKINHKHPPNITIWMYKMAFALFFAHVCPKAFEIAKNISSFTAHQTFNRKTFILSQVFQFLEFDLS